MNHRTPNMKNTFIEFIEQLGMDYRYILNGLLGSLVWAIYKKTKLIQALRQMLIGSLVAAYFTPIINQQLGFSDQALGATSFTVGMMGMVILDTLYKFVYDKVKKWRKALIIVIKDQDKNK